MRRGRPPGFQPGQEEVADRELPPDIQQHLPDAVHQLDRAVAR